MTDQPKAKPRLSKKAAREILWNRGNLYWLLDATQKELYHSFYAVDRKFHVWLCSRRLGKTFTVAVLAFEYCLKTPGTVVKFVAPTKSMIRQYLRDVFREILKTCPRELKPEYKTQEYLYRFPNGSEIQLAGTEAKQYETLRGGKSDLCIIDEAGYCSDLDDVLKSVLIPTTLTTNGKIVLLSTPPGDPAHDFNNYIEDAEVKGYLIKKTIFDNKRLTEAQVNEAIEQYKTQDYPDGLSNPDFRKEYLCERVRDRDATVFPEFTDQVEKECVKEVNKPAYFDSYIGMDIGFKDLTVALFAYYDFKNKKVIIEDELVMNGPQMTTQSLAQNIDAKEKFLWGYKPPYLRVADNNLIVINDLHRLHGISFMPTRKDDFESAVNEVRIMIKAGQIIIHPRCKTLLNHMRYARWDKKRKAFARSADHAHYDSCAALVYLIRNIIYTKNPFPKNYELDLSQDTFRSNLKQNMPNYADQILNIFKSKSNNKKT